MSKELFARYGEFEDGLRKQFHEHPVYRTFSNWSAEQFSCYVLQIGFIPQNFVKWYETAKLGLSSEQAREVIRHILRDEIPQDMPTHQDERQFDLQLIGIGPIRALNARPSTGTKRTIQRLYELVAFPQKDYDLRVMITLRVAGEVLVAEQYRHIVRYMKTGLGIDPKQSRFFVPHYVHDLKGKQAEEGGHTDAFNQVLAEMIMDERTLAVAKEAATLAFEARAGINDQFVPGYRIGKAMGAISKVAAAAVAILFLGFVFQKASVQYERERWSAHVAEQPSGIAVSLTECDLNLLHRFRQFHIAADLEKIGTPGACLDNWIGP